MKLILIRHGETSLNKERRIIGLNDVPLNATGIAQAKAVGHALLRDMPFSLYSSPVARAIETACIISGVVNVPSSPIDDMRESDVGELDGLTGAEMRARFPAFIELWTEDPGTAQMPGGESLTQVQKRAWAAVSALAEQHPDESVVVVSHNFTNLAIVTHVLDAPMRYFRRLRQELGSITRLEINKDHNVLVSLNETAHLQGIE